MDTSTTTSPAKRRALAPIDANSKSPSSAGPRILASGKTSVSTTPLKRPLYTLEDAFDSSSSPERREKKTCLDGASPPYPSSAVADRRAASIVSPTAQHLRRDEVVRIAATVTAFRPSTPRSPEPLDSADSSVFDHSTQDITQLTAVTEPDVGGDAAITSPSALFQSSPPQPPPRRRRAMTREEARVKAEMLRLRLGLASYKVKTGQTEVPLERLQRKPLVGATTTIIGGSGQGGARARGWSSLSSSAAAVSMARNAMQITDSLREAAAVAAAAVSVALPNSPGVEACAEGSREAQAAPGEDAAQHGPLPSASAGLGSRLGEVESQSS